jgi:AAA15 family ATPase/GTPase
MDIKVKTVTIENFRGIPGKINIDMNPTLTEKPKSLILSGDNGTGKSSIVDAIQFALQGEIGKERKLKSVISLSSESLPSVNIRLSDGSEVHRSLTLKKDGNVKVSDLGRNKLFYIAPFVLRRSDILRFLNTPDEKRQLIFFEYKFIKDDIQHDDMFNGENVDLQERRAEQKNRRKNLIEKLSRKIAVPVGEIPLDAKEFNIFVRDKIYSGLKAKERFHLNQGDSGYANPIVHDFVSRIRKTNEQISCIQKEQNKISRHGSVLVKDLTRKIIVEDLISKAEDRLTRSFKNISDCDFIDKIELLPGDISAASLTVNIHLKNGRICSPHQIFSEANSDLLVLLVFLSLAKEAAEKGQAKFLILDDILQSVDSTIRVSVVDYILKEFSGWQLVFTVHDRLWGSQLCNLFQRHSHPFIEHEIIGWDFGNGPNISNTPKNADYLLLEAIEYGQIINVCAQAGLLLEEICNKLSWILPISVIRRKEDKYTLGDLWPGVYKVLRKTNIQDIAEEIDKWIHLRNLVGAHYNEWARSLSLQEARLFGKAVLQLSGQVQCKICSEWIKLRDKYWACRCSNINISNK